MDTIYETAGLSSNLIGNQTKIEYFYKNPKQFPHSFKLEGEKSKYQTIQNLLNSKDGKMKDQIRKITDENFILTVNEKMLARKYQYIKHEMDTKEKFLKKVQKEQIENEQVRFAFLTFYQVLYLLLFNLFKVLKDRICVLENGFSLARQHYELLVENLENSVPKKQVNHCQYDIAN